MVGIISMALRTSPGQARLSDHESEQLEPGSRYPRKRNASPSSVVVQCCRVVHTESQGRSTYGKTLHKDKKSKGQGRNGQKQEGRGRCRHSRRFKFQNSELEMDGVSNRVVSRMCVCVARSVVGIATRTILLLSKFIRYEPATTTIVQ